jgi:release factor glutamine methyltransferase
VDRRRALVSTLSTAGFVAPEEEANELLARAGADDALLDVLVGRRLTGEPLAWITGRVSFCDLELAVDPGVYVPRWQTEQLARRAVELLPPAGTAVDLCTGTGAIARALLAAPGHAHDGTQAGARVMAEAGAGARVVATDLDERAVACARANGVEAYCGDLFAPLPGGFDGQVDLVVAVVPYVPTHALALLQRDTLTFESPLSYDGGPDGTDILRRVVTESPRYLRPGGTILLELGGEEADALTGDLSRLGYVDVALLLDDDDDVRGLEATWSG